MIASGKRTLAGVLTGAVARGSALFLFMAPSIDKIPMEPLLWLPVALTPAIVVGAGIGAIAAARSSMWRGVLVGAVLSMATFAIWSNGPLEWWVLSVRFNARLTIYFGIAGAVAGFLPFALFGERSSV